MNEQKENPPEPKEEPEAVPGKEPEVILPEPVQEPAPPEDEPEPEAAGDDQAQSA